MTDQSSNVFRQSRRLTETDFRALVEASRPVVQGWAAVAAKAVR